MKRLLALALVTALVTLGVPTTTFAGPATKAASVTGVAKDMAGRPLSNTSVRLRSVVTGKLAGTARTTTAGAFSFENVAAGNYVVETVDASGRVSAASTSVDVAAGATVAGVTVTAPGEPAAMQAGAATGGGSFFTSTLGIILIAGIAAGTVAAIVATRGDESPKK